MMAMTWWLRHPWRMVGFLFFLPVFTGLLVLQWGYWGLGLPLLLLPLFYRLAQHTRKVDTRLAFYRTLFDEANDAILTIQDGYIRNPNQAACEISGYSCEELEGMEYSLIVAPADRLMIRRNHLRRLEGELPPKANYRFRLQRKDGNLIWVQLRVTRVMWRGRPAVVCVLTDVDDIHRMEQKASNVRRLDAMMEMAGELARDIRLWLSLVKEESRQLLEAEDEEERLIAWQQLKELFNTVQNTLTMLERMAHLEDYRPSVLELEEILATQCMQRVNQRSGANVQLLFQTRETFVFADQSQVGLILQFIVDELLGKPGSRVKIQATLSKERPDEETRTVFQLLDQPYLCLRFTAELESEPDCEQGRGRKKLVFNTMQALAVQNGGVLLEECDGRLRTFELYLPPSRNHQQSVMAHGQAIDSP